MKNYELKQILLPHNLPNGEAYIKKIKKYINTAKELGGTIYDVAEASGLFSASNFLKQHFSEDVELGFTVSDDITVVTEVYVKFSETEELERIFLYSENAKEDNYLQEEGEIKEGKLIIPYEKLRSLHMKGYHCIYGRLEDGHNGKAFVRYHQSFGEDRKMLQFRFLDEKRTFLGNGFNQALLVRTRFEVLFVMPDVYAVEMAVKTYHAEQFIREKYNNEFRIERINFHDEVVKEVYPKIEEELFGRIIDREKEAISESCQRMIYQITYIKVYYPKAYEEIWSEWFLADDESMPISFEPEQMTLAISLGENASYGVALMENGSLKRIPNINLPREFPLNLKYQFKGYETDIKNAGTAGSRMALRIKDIVQSAECLFDASIEHIYLVPIGILPSAEEIAGFMELKREEIGITGDIESASDIIAYEEIAKEHKDGKEVLKWAGELAKLSEFEIVDWISAMVNAYEKVDRHNLLRENEIGLIYDLEEGNLQLALVKKEKEDIQLLAYKQIKKEKQKEYLEFEKLLEKDLEEYMKKEGLEALGFHGTNQRDREAFEKLQQSAKRVRRQFVRNDEVTITFYNFIVSMSAKYPISNLEKCMKPLLEKNDEILQSFLEEMGVSRMDIDKVYLAGEECEYPFVRRYIEENMQKKTCIVSMSSCVAARGAVL